MNADLNRFDQQKREAEEKTASRFSLFPSVSPGLYVHIPFCLKKCHYCDFVITTKRSPLDRARFLTALEKEVKHAAKKYGRLIFSTFYLGGGTPSSLEPGEFETVCEMLHENFDFENGFEFTVEVNPGDVNEAKIKAYRRAGVNRISLGVQAFQDSFLKDMNRSHGTAEVTQTVQLLRSAGMNNLSMDMILNLPNQTAEDVRETLRKLLSLDPNQISVYDLDVHERTVYGLRRREGRLHLGDEEAHAHMAQIVAQTLEQAGLVQYELSNFARPGFESRHNLVYWHNQSYLGLGPGAFSYLNGVRYQFADSVEGYLKKIAGEDHKNDSEDALSAEEIEKETFLTGIRLKDGIDLRRVPILREAFEGAARLWLQEGLLEKDGFRLKFTARGKPVAETMLQAFAQVKKIGKD